jgi:hypothetical protein
MPGLRGLCSRIIGRVIPHIARKTVPPHALPPILQSGVIPQVRDISPSTAGRHHVKHNEPRAPFHLHPCTTGGGVRWRRGCFPRATRQVLPREFGLVLVALGCRCWSSCGFGSEGRGHHRLRWRTGRLALQLSRLGGIVTSSRRTGLVVLFVCIAWLLSRSFLGQRVRSSPVAGAGTVRVISRGRHGYRFDAEHGACVLYFEQVLWLAEWGFAGRSTRTRSCEACGLDRTCCGPVSSNV